MSLFNDFKSISHQDWLEKITQDLKGKDFSETLIWKTDEGINVQPFYDAETLNDNVSQNFDLTNCNNDWEIREQVEIKTIKEANQLALNALKGGANSIQFNGNIENQNEMNELLADIMLDIIHIHFYTSTPDQTLNFFNTFIENNNIDKALLKGSITYDYLGELLISGNWSKDEKTDFNDLFNIQNKTSLKTITIRGDYYANAGATITQEIAYTLNQTIEYFDQLTERGISAESAINNISFNLGINSNYFFEIAKIRAFKILWQLITKTYGIEGVEANIHAQTSNYNIAAQDAQTNILRTTTEGMSAVLGGCNSLSITPFNSSYEAPSDFTLRVARNIQIILKEEAYLNKVKDASKGAYYIENLTDELVTKSLDLFKEVENNGGFLANIKNDTIQNSIEEVNLKKETEYKDGTQSLLGVNIHINNMENSPKPIINQDHNSNGSIKHLKQINIPQLIAQQGTSHA
jgi:methylmalonyl-CoA mutase